MYDYGARHYDPALGCWMNSDPKGELLEKSLSYVYSLNITMDEESKAAILDILEMQIK
jgi:RHS repeat-associated protein